MARTELEGHGHRGEVISFNDLFAGVKCRAALTTATTHCTGPPGLCLHRCITRQRITRQRITHRVSVMDTAPVRQLVMDHTADQTVRHPARKYSENTSMPELTYRLVSH